jgi:hypothetical protein
VIKGMTNSIFVKHVSDFKKIIEFCDNNYPNKGFEVVKFTTVKQPGKYCKVYKKICPSKNYVRSNLRFGAKVNIYFEEGFDTISCKKYINSSSDQSKNCPSEKMRFNLNIRSVEHFYKIVTHLNDTCGIRDEKKWKSRDHWRTVGKGIVRNLRNEKKTPIKVTFIVYDDRVKEEDVTLMALW